MGFGCDYDETLVPFAEKGIDFHNRKYGTEFTIEDMKEYSFEKLFGVSVERGRGLVDEFLDSDDFRNLGPTKSVVDAVRRIARVSGSGYIVTSRHDRFRDLTRKRAVEDFRLDSGRPAFVAVCFAKNKYNGQCQDRKTKDEFCKHFGADFMIEDDLAYAVECANKGIVTFLIDKPWNQGDYLSQNIVRVSSMTGVAEFLERRQRGLISKP